jgi:uncharacterized protein (AIM24 family)
LGAVCVWWIDKSIPDRPTVPEVDGVSASGMAHRIFGTVQQTLLLDVPVGRTVFSDTGALSWMTSSIEVNAATGGEGRWLGTLTGPGRVWLHSLTVSKVAHRVREYLPRPSGG